MLIKHGLTLNFACVTHDLYYTKETNFDGMTENEIKNSCVRIRKLESMIGKNSLEYFYLCEYVSGEFSTGTGEEFQEKQNKGVYKPTFINIKEISNLPLMPSEVAKQLFEDYKVNGQDVRKDNIDIGMNGD